MGRPSKLSDKKWSEITRRHAEGERAADLAREYRVSPTQISRRVSHVVKSVQAIAIQVATAEQAFDSLPIAQQSIARSLADNLRGISEGLATAANLNAHTAARLAGIASRKATLLGDESDEADLRPIAALMETSNRASYIGVNLLSANKDKQTTGELTLEQLVIGGGK